MSQKRRQQAGSKDEAVSSPWQSRGVKRRKLLEAERKEDGCDVEEKPLKPVAFVNSSSSLDEDDELPLEDDPHLDISRPEREYIQDSLSEDKLEELYGFGFKAVLGMGHAPGTSLDGDPDGVHTCLRGRHRYNTGGYGLGFGGPRVKLPPDVWKFRVNPPKCVDCSKEHWPSWRSKKGRWHCGQCHRPEGGRPRCYRCSKMTWDGWNGPNAHGRVWWCHECWCIDQEDGAQEWEEWFKYRRVKWPEAFANGGPELLPYSSSKKAPKRASKNKASTDAGGQAATKGFTPVDEGTSKKGSQLQGSNLLAATSKARSRPPFSSRSWIDEKVYAMNSDLFKDKPITRFGKECLEALEEKVCYRLLTELEGRAAEVDDPDTWLMHATGRVPQRNFKSSHREEIHQEEEDPEGLTDDTAVPWEDSAAAESLAEIRQMLSSGFSAWTGSVAGCVSEVLEELRADSAQEPSEEVIADDESWTDKSRIRHFPTSAPSNFLWGRH